MQGKAALMVFVTLGSPDNFSQNKRVESIKVARLDPGSTPGRRIYAFLFYFIYKYYFQGQIWK